MTCSICGGRVDLYAEGEVRRRYVARCYRCVDCGFLQVRDPTWLPEAYRNAMTAVDLGHVYRCDSYSRIAKSLIHAFYNPRGRFLDYGAGYGLFARRMRDLGYDFRWYDKSCENLFARGFEAQADETAPYELATAFEVFEHLMEPERQVADLTGLSREILFTTEVLPMQPPPLEDWWYYGLEHGQHIAFYTVESLRRLAQRLDSRLVTNGRDLHLITRRRLSQSLFRFITKSRMSAWFNRLTAMPSLLPRDFQEVRQQVLSCLSKTDGVLDTTDVTGQNG
jgi:hypothetical protein